MSAIDLGKIMITPAGEWSPDRSYEILTAVEHNGSGYVAVADNTAVEPGTDDSVWMMFAQAGHSPELTIDEDGILYSDGEFFSSVIADSVEGVRGVLGGLKGGLHNQVLTKNSDKDGDYRWENLQGGGGAGIWGFITGQITNQVDLNNALGRKQDKITDIETIRTGAASGATAYQKPIGGIPATDMANGVIPDVSSFISRTVNNLANYYLKSETYTKSEVQQLLSTVQGISLVKVDELPEASASTMGGKIYLIPNEDDESIRDEYITIDNGVIANPRFTWEFLGSTGVSMDGYVTENDLDEALEDYAEKTDIPEISTNIETDKLSDVKTASPKAVVTVTGSLSDLQTTAKSSLVAAINEAMQTGGGSAENALVDISVPSPYDGTLIFTYGNGDTITVDLNHNHPQYASKVEVANLIPAGGMLPNTQYNLGTLSGNVTFTLAAPADATIRNEYMFTFDTGSTAPIPTWPLGITKWKGECVNSGTGQPVIAANKHYEVSLLNGYAYIAEI